MTRPATIEPHSTEFEAGDTVRIKTGPLAGSYGYVLWCGPHEAQVQVMGAIDYYDCGDLERDMRLPI